MLLSLMWLLMPAIPRDTSTCKEQGFCRVSAVCKCLLFGDAEPGE